MADILDTPIHKESSAPHPHDANGFQLQHSDTTITMPREVFEKLYLQPQNRVRGDLRKRFGNPTPLALVGLIAGAFPLACNLMGWRGAGGLGAATVGVYLYLSGAIEVLAAIGEWILGNTFSCVVFGTLGGFFLSFGATFQPYNNAEAAYGASTITPQFASSYAFFLLAMAIISFFFLVCSVRTNVLLVFVFLCLTLSFALLSGAYWAVADLKVDRALKLEKAGGGTLFALSIGALAILFVQLLDSVDFPYTFAVGDLSEVVKGRAQIERAKQERAHREGGEHEV